jgi:hypothetical protein
MYQIALLYMKVAKYKYNWIITQTIFIVAAALVRYQIAGNFLGLPAVTVPVMTLSLSHHHRYQFSSANLNYVWQVGYDKNGLPIGLQFIGRPWSEPTLIHIAYAMQVYYQVLRFRFLYYFSLWPSIWIFKFRIKMFTSLTVQVFTNLAICMICYSNFFPNPEMYFQIAFKLIN